MSSLNSGPAKKEALPPTRVEAFEKMALSFWAANPTICIAEAFHRVINMCPFVMFLDIIFMY